MSAREVAIQELRSAGWSRIAGALSRAAVADLPIALQHFWLFIALFPMDGFAGRILCELGRRTLERLAQELGVDVTGARAPLDVVPMPPRRVLS